MHTTVDGIRLFVWDLDAELLRYCQICLCCRLVTMTNLLNCHNHLDGVETVKSEVVVEVRLAVQLNCVSLSLRWGPMVGERLRMVPWIRPGPVL